MVVKKPKALALISGGLDSVLAAKLLIDQKIEVTGICFISPFFNCVNAEKAVKNLGIKLKVIDISVEQLELVKNPPCGYGKHLNPCIDCHSEMVRRAAKIAKQENFDIIATGEVLGQRPFSQARSALGRVDKLAGADILRPLSAKLLEETNYEKQELVKRGLLKDIKGRSRGRQMDLVRKYKISDYITPAGGCLLTDKKFCERLLKMLDYWPDCNINDVELLKNGRVFWLKHSSGDRVLLIVGRNQEENQQLHNIRERRDISIELEDVEGPTTLIRKLEIARPASLCEAGGNWKFGKSIKITVPVELKLSILKFEEKKSQKDIIDIACLLTGYYSTKTRGKSIKFKIMI